MSYLSEKEMYPDVMEWLKTYLQHKYSRASISVHDTSRQDLCEFLRRENLSNHFQQSETFVIKVDITGIIILGDTYQLAFVECKIGSINLKDVSQLIGYSKVVIPIFSMIVSPAGISPPINKLVNIYRRYDILNYKDDLLVRIATWNRMSKDINSASVLPHGLF
ncbi:MAG: hypothetical protein WC374_05635 [Phycisphaerae bacterium]|jgi:hypothetical protein